MMRKTEIAGPEKREPVRMCVICRCRMAKAGLRRHVLNGKERLVPDERQILPGRGFYCCDDLQCQKKFAGYKPGGKSVKKLVKK